MRPGEMAMDSLGVSVAYVEIVGATGAEPLS
jgi:hypothetical protein